MIAALCILAAATNAQQPVLDQLGRSIDWYRRVSALSSLATEPRDVVYAAQSAQDSRQALGFAFDFARAQAAEVQDTPPMPVDAPQSSALIPAIEIQAQETQAELQDVQRQLAAARPADRPRLTAQVAELKAELALAQARAQTLKALSDFATQTGNQSTGLLARIAELERSVPGLHAQTKDEAAQPAPKPPPSGILGFAAETFTLLRKIQALHSASLATTELRADVDKLRAPLVDDVKKTLAQADHLARAADTADVPGLSEQRKQLDAITQHFKQVSAELVPLGKQIVLLESEGGNLSEWRMAADADYDAALRGLLLRLLVLGGAVFLVLTASGLWRRATNKYVRDPRRRQQMVVVRRVVVAGVLTLLCAFSLVSESGSLATYAGFITAGLAVALQNVILSVAAYFFLVGRSGIRVGDRVQISGVTGDVVDIGLVRLHVMEVRPDGLPTGRVVVFSNSVFFSNANFFKQLPGTRFAWHELKLTLKPEVDVRLAEQKLLGAVTGIYTEYREKLDQEHAAVQENLDLSVTPPRPEARLRLAETGLELLLRYPVPLDDASLVDDRVNRAVLDALEREPALKMAGATVTASA